MQASGKVPSNERTAIPYIMDDYFKPALTTTNWNEEWKELQRTRRHPDDAAAWDERAKTFPVKHGSQQGYVERFLELVGIRTGERVLDMGCGTGALATPLALAGHEVIACDFSRGMLDAMEADQAQLGITTVESKQMSWDDDWEEFGLDENCVDVAIASRSIATYDLEESLMKLGFVARRRACITLPCASSPKIDEKLLAACGFEKRLGRDFLYAFNILASQGINPEVAYIDSTRYEVFPSFDDALRGFSALVSTAVEGIADDAEVKEIPERLRPWLEKNLVHDEEGVHLSQARRVTWAFLAWQPPLSSS